MITISILKTLFELVGEVTNRHYKLGQKVYIRVIGVDEIVRTIDFELAAKPEEAENPEETAE